MARQSKDIDWYVDLSERLERRESRRRWLALALCVAVPLLLIGSLALYAVAQERGWIASLWARVRGRTPEPLKQPQPQERPVRNETVPALCRGDIRFSQNFADGLPTGTVHYFRERKPDKVDAFTLSLQDERHGVVIRYGLENLGTTDVYEFANVAVEKIDNEWRIAEPGWLRIRNELQAKMAVFLGPRVP
jgi:hypothetical protein